MKYLFICLAFFTVFFAERSVYAIAPSVDKPVAVLRVLDKTTARVAELSIPVNQTTAFGTLSITARSCRVTPPEEVPEAAVFLDIDEKKGEGDVQTPVFHGWMFASSPALSAMQHPIYDIWVIGCAEAIVSPPK